MPFMLVIPSDETTGIDHLPKLRASGDPWPDVLNHGGAMTLSLGKGVVVNWRLGEDNPTNRRATAAVYQLSNPQVAMFFDGHVVITGMETADLMKVMQAVKDIEAETVGDEG